MGFDQKNKTVFRVQPADKTQWGVYEQGFEEPLATFDSKQDACDYADDLAKQKDGSKVIVRDNDSKPESEDE